MRTTRRIFSVLLVLATLIGPGIALGRVGVVTAATPASDTLTAPSGSGPATVTWSGGPYSGAVLDPSTCTSATCDTYTLNFAAPADYWTTHNGGVTIHIDWTDSSADFDLFVYDSKGTLIASATGGAPETQEKVDLGKLAPGTYTVRVEPSTVVSPTSFTGTATVTSTYIPPSMIFPETKNTILKLLTVDYPLNVIFVGHHPSAAEVQELKSWIPADYQPTVSSKSPSGNETQNTGATLLNWNKNHLTKSRPYFVGMRYNYKIHVIDASDAYAQALFQVAKDKTAQDQTYHSSTRGANVAKYDATFGKYRLLAKNGDTTYRVADPTRHDLIDSYAIEDWIFNSRFDSQWNCAFKDVETDKCLSPSVINPDRTAYHDNYYDKNGLNIDHMPQGVNKGSSVFFFDTFTPNYASSYFRPNAYHTWGTDKVINGQIVPKSVDAGGSWRITDPDTGAWAGVDFSRTWGGRYRFHFFDLGAAPNDYESASWLKSEKTMSSDYPFGDPPIWQYEADPQWQQTGDTCVADPQVTNYTGATPCRLMPRLGRDVAYNLFFRSTAGYLYRPIPRGDVNWLSVSNWTDFYSHPQWVNGQATNAPWYGAWWMNMHKLYDANNVLRWLSAAEPYVRWVGRPGETIPLFDPNTNQPTGGVLDTSPKYADLPAPKYHVQLSATGTNVAPEPLYPGDANHVIKQYGSTQVDLTNVSNAIEKAKATGVFGFGYDDSVNANVMRDFIDANRSGIADQIPGVNTIPSINIAFEKVYTWALPAIVGGIAEQTKDGEAWGVLNNVNDRFGWSGAHYPMCQPTDTPGTQCSLTNASTPSQDSGTGFSYTIEHEAAHNLGLSHPHDGSLGVDRCPANDPNYPNQWECYWSGLGWVMDISAAPTTYAMDYHPYEVEDQDNLQRGRTAEYLVKAQDALQQRLTQEAAGGATTPSAGYSADYTRMTTWRSQSADLFACGDYLHAEYAARNASLAAQGYPQTAANTVDPKLLEAGQVYYFNLHSQCTKPLPDLTVSNLTATQSAPRTVTLGVTVSNIGDAPASGVTVRFTDGTTTIGTTSAIALDAGATSQVSVPWNVTGLNGTHTITATVDPDNLIVESNKNNNSTQTTVTIRRNRLQNGSFETTSNGTQPANWQPSSAGGTSYDTSGTHSSDGIAAVGISANGLLAGAASPAWTSDPVSVTPGQTYNLAMNVAGTGLSSAPSMSVLYLDAVGNVLNTVTGISTGLTGDVTSQQVLGTVTIPSGVSSVRIQLNALSPTDLNRTGTVWFDDVWLY